ncbi:MAG: hypothetical protein WCD75_00795, partial [Rhodoplanes sp.]
DLLLALWICRISTASAIIGLLLFWLAPQARDLFRDVSGGLGATGLENSSWKMFPNIGTFPGLRFWECWRDRRAEGNWRTGADVPI